VTDLPDNKDDQSDSKADIAGSDALSDEQSDELEAPYLESAEETELDGLEKALSKAEHELADHREAMLRMQAEMENLRKRLIKDLERSRMRSLEGFMKDLLPVRDSLERGLETDEATTTVESMKEGKALIIKMLAKVMEDHGLKVIDPAGQPFDPELHQAMAMQESTEYEANTVIEVLQKGFQLNDRLVRPAMVLVAKSAG
jgi:molecular chaperone GrpE